MDIIQLLGIDPTTATKILAWATVAYLFGIAIAKLLRVLGFANAAGIVEALVLDLGKLIEHAKPMAQGKKAVVDTVAKTGAMLGVIAFTLSFQACSVLRSPGFWDGIEQTCKLALTSKQEVIDEAGRRKLVLGEFAGELCEIPDIIEPFVVEANGARKLGTPAADEAVSRAQAKGLLK